MCMKWQHTAKQILKVTTSLTLFTHVSMLCIYRTNTPAHAHMCPHTHTYEWIQHPPTCKSTCMHTYIRSPTT